MIAVRIKQLRESNNLDISDLESLTGISAAHLYRMEKGERTPGADTLAKLAPALGTTSDYLIGLTDNPASRPNPDQISLAERTLSDPELRQIVTAWPRLSERSRKTLAGLAVEILAVEID